MIWTWYVDTYDCMNERMNAWQKICLLVYLLCLAKGVKTLVLTLKLKYAWMYDDQLIMLWLLPLFFLYASESIVFFAIIKLIIFLVKNVNNPKV